MLDAKSMAELQPGSRGDPQSPAVRTRRWTCVQTHPQAERWCSSQLSHRGYVTFLPMMAVLRRDRHTPTIAHSVLVPLFPCYLFVQFSQGDPWTPIRYADGVARLFMAGNGLQQVSAGAVEGLRASEAFRATPIPADGWKARGVACSLGVGPFKGLPAVIMELRAQVARVQVMFLGELRQLSCHTDQLVPRHG
jgi:transcription antitermination factor NusG